MSPPAGIELEIVVEIPRGSFLKRGSSGRIDFVSPFPCPFNYGAVPSLLGLEGDLLDALVLGPRLPAGTLLRLPCWQAIVLVDRGMIDHKLVCGPVRPSAAELRFVEAFFGFYAQCKRLLNLCRGQGGRHACDGWCSIGHALDCARPRPPGWCGSPVKF